MQVFELNIKVYLLKDIMINEVQNYLSYFIDNQLVNDSEFEKLHNENTYKYYTFDSLYPLAQDGIYKANLVYNFRIRTIDTSLAKFLLDMLPKSRTEEFQGLVGEIKILKPGLIKKLYCLTPAVTKTDSGYWKGIISIEDYENQLKINLIKKYNQWMHCKLDEDFQFHYQIHIKNKIPVARKYKNITLLGDMLELEIAENDNAQLLAWMAIGTGIFEMNARGFGFVNYSKY